jgi:DNA mismatch repair protein MSH5
MFSTEEQIYFKNNEMREMDDHFGDLHGIISDREIEISHDLAQFVLEYEELITTASDICGELDSLLALAQGAKMYKLAKPTLTEENVIKIKGGRHILQELVVPSFISNDTDLAGGRGDDAMEEDAASLLVLTGPNYSGKSVYLKQVALIVFMAHVGRLGSRPSWMADTNKVSFVPADSARIGLTDKILTRVTTRETVSRVGSTPDWLATSH